MSNDRKRKIRTTTTTATTSSRHRFWLRLTPKVLVVEGEPEQTARTLSGSSSGGHSGAKETYRQRIGRRGSALVSILLLRRNKAHDMPVVPAGGQCPGHSTPDESRRVSAPHTTCLNSMVQSPVVFAAESRFQPPFPAPAATPFDASSVTGYVAPSKRRLDDAEDGEVRRTCSSPGFTERLANRISTAFGPPTVIHHPTSKIRTGLSSILFNLPAAPLVPVPSVNNNSGNGIVDGKRVLSDASIQSRRDNILSYARTASTGPATISSSVLSPDAKERALFSPISDSGRSRVSSPMSLASSKGQAEHNLEHYQPSIVSVEAAATAKIYFETYFNSILSAENPREQRYKAFEGRLASLPMTWEEKNLARQTWCKKESEYLRQYRVLKSKADFRKDGEGMSIAGYEVIKVLGKGSFGVVRLVREKATENENEPPPRRKTNDHRDDAVHHRPRAASAMDALRAAVDGSRPVRRRELSKAKKEVYAMKVIRKSDMLRNCQEGHIRAERDFLVASAKSQWVVPLIASFQDQHYLYLVMDYMVGGDFLGLLIRKNILSEDVTRFYIAEMILCVEEAHRLRWIHRDVKPDNFLISASGHLKISDFGLAFNGHWSHTQSYYTNHRQTLLDKLGICVEGDLEDKKAIEKNELEKLRLEGMSPDLEEMARNPNFYKSRIEKIKEYNRMEGRGKIDSTGPPPGESILKWRNREEKRKLAKSVVGTSQYMAPEVIRGELYDGRCDWWSIGIILYECLYGFTPFTAENRHDTKLKILKHTQTLRFPVESSSERLVSAEAIDLIEQILQEKEYRLCSKKYLLNDFAHSDRYPGELINCPADKNSKNYRGYFVYSNDAEDIKAHPFFKGMQWQEVHLRRPPFVPKVKGWEDTRYFDDDEPISDIANTTVTEGKRGEGGEEGNKAGDCQGLAEVPSNGGNNSLLTPPASPKPCPLKHYVTTCRHPCVVAGSPPPDDKNKDNQQEKGHRRREKKRPRDKVLRDEELAEKALKVRKRGAFLGYAYRRAKDVYSELGIERGRSLIAARDYS